MTMADQTEKQPAQAALDRIVASARRLGVELDEQEAVQWLTAMIAGQGENEIVFDEESGVFGHHITMLDFSDEDLAHFRHMARLVEFMDEPGQVETALALSGSAAQSKIQTYPGDADFFERINIKAAGRPEACRILARLIRNKVQERREGPAYRLVEVRFGSYPETVLRRQHRQNAGASITWSAAEVLAGQIELARLDGSPLLLTWEEAAADPGWCKLDWVVADPVRGQLANASLMLDVTWEAPDGSITPLDGYLDPYFQEVYLEADSIPLFSKLAEHVSADALRDYVEALEEQVRHYVRSNPRNYGKAAKRMYNVFRLTGRYPEAAYVRELFDEPTTLLYQAGALIRTMDEAAQPGSSIPMDTIIAQADNLIVQVVSVLEGAEESAIVRTLLRLRDGLGHQMQGQAWNDQVEAARAEMLNLVNNFFREKLTSVPSIKDYLDQLQDEE